MKKQILALLGVSTLAYASANLSFTETQAANIPSPANWTYRYDRVANPTFGFDWFLEKNGGQKLDDPLWNYNSQFNFYDLSYNWNQFGGFRNGLTLEAYIDGNVSGSFFANNGLNQYYPNGNLNTSNGNFFVKMNNNTDYDHTLWFDVSLTANTYFNIKTTFYGSNNQTIQTFLYNVNAGVNIYLPARTNIMLETWQAGTTKIFSGLYIRELGLNLAYQNGYDAGYFQGYFTGEDVGYDAGYNAGYSAGYDAGELQGYPSGYDAGYDDGLDEGLTAVPIQSLFTAIFGGIAQIFNINIFGTITLGTIILAPIAVALLWFILGIVSGVGTKK
jgi:hypothetical protein